MKLLRTALLLSVMLLPSAGVEGEGFDSFGEYEIRSQIKVTGNGKVVNVPIKPMKLSVSCDGATVRIASSGQTEAWSSFKIYRSDGIGRQKVPGGPLEVVPGIQATSNHGGVHKHLRLTKDSLILTVFPGVSDQTVITHAVLSSPAADESASGSVEEPNEP